MVKTIRNVGECIVDLMLKSAMQQGLGYGMFVFLLLYVLRTTGEREKRYQNLLDKVTDKLNIVTIIKQDVKEIKCKIEGGKME